MADWGVFTVSRGFWDDGNFRDEPYTERLAWLWLISAATWKPIKLGQQRGTVDLERGEFCFAVRFMADRWKWDKNRVSRFLARLENEDMIRDTTRDRAADGKRIYFISNYNKYQTVGLPKLPASGTPNEQETGQQRDSGGTKKKQVNQVNHQKTPSLRSGVQRGKRREEAHPIGDYRPGDPVKAKAIAYWKSKGRTDLPAHVDREADLFVAHHKRAGTLGVDWDAGWQTWYVRAVEISKPMNGHANGSRLGFRDGPAPDPAADYEARLKAEKAKPASLFDTDKPP